MFEFQLKQFLLSCVTNVGHRLKAPLEKNKLNEKVTSSVIMVEDDGETGT